MIKRIALLALLLCNGMWVFAQDVDKNSDSKTEIQKPSRDFVMLQFGYTGWQNKPDSVKMGGFGHSFNAYVCYDFPIAKSNFSFAAGIGISTSAVYFKKQANITNDTGNSAVIRFVDTSGLKRDKLTTAYLQAPFELRFFGNKINRNKGFKAAIGLQVGTLLGAHNKYVYTIQGTNTKVNEKVSTRRFMNTWEFQGTARLGWGNFSLFGSYNLTSLYKENKGPQVVPFALGICITGL
ncbi:MAG: outer membrane beta-barrel protein [Bacteroidetes bacterium]|nr:outer membrane beta-barrel protein [Bacteroidota bacterium]